MKVRVKRENELQQDQMKITDERKITVYQENAELKCLDTRFQKTLLIRPENNAGLQAFITYLGKNREPITI